jgi:PEGA domain
LTGELNLQVNEPEARIWVDGEEVGRSSYRSVLPAGRRHVRVERPGFDPFDAWIEVEAGQVHAETIALRPTVAVLEAPTVAPDVENSNRLYGGLSLLGVLEPMGAGTPFESACDTLGATRCDADTPLGAGLGAYVGWFLDPLGLELALMGTAHVQEANVTFDGVNGSDINPVVATPEREEHFVIGRFGGGGAVRARFAYSAKIFRLWIAAGPGLVYRTMVFRRTTEAANGDTSTVAQPWIDYWSPLLSLEAGVQLRVTPTFGLSLGVTSWLESAGEDAKSRARNDTFLVNSKDEPTARQATPAYDLARGPQWFIGPMLGFNFGL